MKTKMKVICINNFVDEDNEYNEDIRKSFTTITVGKSYTIYKEWGLYFRIKDDSGLKHDFHKTRFLSLKDQRKLKIQKLEIIK